MKVFTTELNGVLLIQPDIFKDERGFFFESFSKKKYEQIGIQTEFLQDNISFSLKNVLRGLHFQSSNPQGKLVYALQGNIYDVVVDIRRGSPTYGKWIGYELSDENNLQLWIPPGFAHGFCVLSESAFFCYKVSNYYTPQAEVTIAWNDPELDIDWPIDHPTLSVKDSDVALLDQVNEDLLPLYEEMLTDIEAILFEDNMCRLCSSSVQEIVNLGSSSPANNFVDSKLETTFFYPLILDFCSNCFCVQLRHCIDQDVLYKNYTYMTPDIDYLNNHYDYLIDFLKKNNVLSNQKKCLEVGSNTGLFIKKLSPELEKVIGIDPAENIAKIANESGLETICDFFGPKSSAKILSDYGPIDLIVARHMFAHNVDPNILLQSMNNILTENGTVLIENAYIIPTLMNGEFDQIYHEHMFYYSVSNMQHLLKNNGLELYDLMYSKIHGGSISFLCSRIDSKKPSSKIKKYLEEEAGHFKDMKVFNQFNKKIIEIKHKVLNEINQDISEGKRVAAYGATAKAFTMFSFLDIDADTIEYCVDTTPTKIKKYFPGLGIKVISEEEFKEVDADTILVTAWNYKEHIISKSRNIFSKKTKLIFPLPEFDIHIVD